MSTGLDVRAGVLGVSSSLDPTVTATSQAPGHHLATRFHHIIFVSHAVEDEDEAEMVREWLHRAFPGCAALLSAAYDSIGPGDVWWAEMARVMGDTDAMIVCVTRQNAHRPWLLFDAGAAAGRNIPVIPLILDGSSLEILPTPLRRYEAVFSTPRGSLELIMQLGRILHRVHHAVPPLPRKREGCTC